MSKSTLLAVVRIGFALLACSAIVTEIITISGRGNFVPANFFSYFTIESNLFAVAVLFLSGMALITGKSSAPVALLRGANTFNMIVVGVVFSLLLSGLENTEFTAVPWDNIVLHYIMPVAVALDWLLDPPKTNIPFRKALVWLLFPLTYVVYSLVRGYYTGWYPYPFLNPTEQGYAGVAATSTVILCGGIGLVWLLTRLAKPGKPARVH